MSTTSSRCWRVMFKTTQPSNCHITTIIYITTSSSNLQLMSYNLFLKQIQGYICHMGNKFWRRKRLFEAAWKGNAILFLSKCFLTKLDARVWSLFLWTNIFYKYLSLLIAQTIVSDQTGPLVRLTTCWGYAQMICAHSWMSKEYPWTLIYDHKNYIWCTYLSWEISNFDICSAWSLLRKKQKMAKTFVGNNWRKSMY